MNGKVICQFNLNGELIHTFNNFKEIFNSLKLKNTNIINCCNGRSKTAYGYIWKYG